MGRELHPVEAHRRSIKKRAVERKKAARKEALLKIPVAGRDPSKLLIEIERLREAECQDRLDGPGRMRRKHLEEQFKSLNKAREKAKLPTLCIPEYDPDEYLARLRRTRTTTIPSETFKLDRNVSLSGIPMPADSPYAPDEFPSILPSYRLSVPAELSEIQGTNIISRPPSNIESAVDQFLEDIKEI